MKFVLFISSVLLAVEPYIAVPLPYSSSSYENPFKLFEKYFPNAFKSSKDFAGKSFIKDISQYPMKQVEGIISKMQDTMANAENFVQPIRRVIKDEAEKQLNETLKKIEDKQREIGEDVESPENSKCKSLLGALPKLIRNVFNELNECVTTRFQNYRGIQRKVIQIYNTVVNDQEVKKNESQKCQQGKEIEGALKKNSCVEQVATESFTSPSPILLEVDAYVTKSPLKIFDLTTSISNCVVGSGFKVLVNGIDRILTEMRLCSKEFLDGILNLSRNGIFSKSIGEQPEISSPRTPTRNPTSIPPLPESTGLVTKVTKSETTTTPAVEPNSTPSISIISSLESDGD